MVIKQGIDDLNALEKAFGLPSGYIDALKNEDDWNIIIKSHALLESACANMLTHYFGKNELIDFFALIEMSNKRTGKAAIISALKILDKKERSFISTLSELRNMLVHNASNVCFSISDYLVSLNAKKRSEIIKSLNIRLKSIQINGQLIEGEELANKYPILVIWGSLTYCLFKIYIQSVFYIERNNMIDDFIEENASKGPKHIQPEDITLTIGSSRPSGR